MLVLHVSIALVCWVGGTLSVCRITNCLVHTNLCCASSDLYLPLPRERNVSNWYVKNMAQSQEPTTINYTTYWYLALLAHNIQLFQHYQYTKLTINKLAKPCVAWRWIYKRALSLGNFKKCGTLGLRILSKRTLCFVCTRSIKTKRPNSVYSTVWDQIIAYGSRSLEHSLNKCWILRITCIYALWSVFKWICIATASLATFFEHWHQWLALMTKFGTSHCSHY